MQKKFLAVFAVGAAVACVQAAPQRYPQYEPDGKSVSGAPAASANLFLKAKVSATGQWDKQAPTFAVDGKSDKSDEHWAAENLPQALTVDMGAVKKLSEIRLVPYWTDQRVYGFKVEGSADGKTWKMLSDKTANTVCAGEAGFLLDFPPAEVRYVRTTFTANNRGKTNGAHIVEIEGYANASDRTSAFLVGDIYARYDRDLPVDRAKLAPVAKLKGWRGERVSAMLVASSPRGFDELRLTAGNPNACIDVVRYTLGNGKLYGDILDGNTQTKFKGVTRPVVYTLNIPNDASGVIRDTVTAVINGEKREIPVEITVVPRTLPPSKDWHFHLDFWQQPDSVARWHDVAYGSEEHLALNFKYNRLLADMGQKVITAALIDEPWNHQTFDDFRSGIQPTKHADGKWSYDYTVFDKIIENGLAAGLGPQIDCYSMLTWSLKFRYFDEKANRFVAPRMQPDSAAYEEFWGNLLEDFCKHLKEKGWFKHTKIAMDERPDKLLKPALKVLRKHAPELGMVAACNHVTGMTDEMFSVAPIYGLSGPFTGIAPKRRQQGLVTKYYVCCSPARPNTFVFSDPAESEWLAPFAAAMDLDGLLRWAWNSWVLNPLDSQDFTAWPSGDTSLVYPGPRLSLRSLLLRDGIETYEKLRVLGRGQVPELKAFTIKRGGEQGVHAADLRALNEAVNK